MQTLVRSSCFHYSGNIYDTSLRDYVISGHVLRTITRTHFGECFRLCALSCECRSFNLNVEENGVCELNSIDKEKAPNSLQRKDGFVHFSFGTLSHEVNIIMCETRKSIA